MSKLWFESKINDTISKNYLNKLIVSKILVDLTLPMTMYTIMFLSKYLVAKHW